MDHSRFLFQDRNDDNNNNNDDDDHESGGDIPQQQQRRQLLQLIDQEEWINLHGITAEPRYGNQSESNQQLERERIQQEREYQSTVHQTIFGVQDDDDDDEQERIKNFRQWEHQQVMVELKVQQSNHSTNDENDKFNSDENPNPTDTVILRVNLVTLARHSDVVYTLAVNRKWFPNTCHQKQPQDDGSLPSSAPLQISLLEFSKDTVLLFLDILADTSDTTTTTKHNNNSKFLYNIDHHLSSDQVVDCCRLASFLQCISLLHQIVHDILVPAVDSHNCMSLYQLADQLSLPKLLEASVNHMIQSLDSTLQQQQSQQHSLKQSSNNTTTSTDNENDGNISWDEYLTTDLQAQIVTIQNILRSSNRKQMFFSTVTEYLAMLSEQYQYYHERLEEAIEQQDQHPTGTVGWNYSQTKIELQQVKVERLRQFVDEQRRLLGGGGNGGGGATTTKDTNEIQDETDHECNNQHSHSEHGQDPCEDNHDRISSSLSHGSNKRQCGGGSSFITVRVVSCICILLGLCYTATSSTPWTVTRSNPFGVRPYTHLQRQRYLWSSQVLPLRGGDAPEEYDDDEYDAEEEEQQQKVVGKNGRTKLPSPQRRNPKETYDHSMIDLPPDPTHGGRPVPSRRRQPPPTPLRKKKKKPHWSQRLATSSLQMTGQLAWNTLIKQPTKLAYHVIRPKYVDIRETDGLWRLEQQVTEREGREVASVATIELQAKPRIVILRKEEQPTTTTNTKNNPNQPNVLIIKEPYTFTKKKLTGSFQTQFVIPAFLIGENQMRLYGYRGTWQRKLADKRVIKLVGKIYQVHKQRFGKNRGEYVFGQAVGTFVARRRIEAKIIDKEEELEDMDEYDGDEEEEKEDVEEEWEEIDENWEDEEEAEE
ncbi:hypothetical protein IV203_030318 [Nitzschia inconspicua]|uniref:Uncharacterized protein n=1 Tax=Nitzschia inconspicua TaxID=303405 RepID=A0A9K3Q166_9STRA|nr:hypothetical protein IV203_030318 [Nitzschia inconspicua]